MIDLTELEEALRDDADVMRAGATVRLNLDDAADAVAELRKLLAQEGRRCAECGRLGRPSNPIGLTLCRECAHDLHSETGVTS